MTLPSICHTYLQVQDEVNRTIASLVAWSMEIATSGIALDKGFAGEEFAKNMYRYDMQGKQLANGWKPLV